MSKAVESSPPTLRNLFDELVELAADQRERRILQPDVSETMRGDVAAMLLFDEFVDMTDAERRRVLEERSLPETLRARMESMLRVDSCTPDSVRASAADALRHLGDDEHEAIGTLLIGASIGTFRLLQLIGEGGSSTVFRAERDSGDGVQSVALKLLRNGVYSADAQRRFRREQGILAQLTHPNIARLIEGGVSSAGIPYIAMEFVDGRPLTIDANARALNLADRLRLIITLCRAIDAAHASLIVHRDLKPSNVLMTSGGELKVVDFGIARLLDEEGIATRTQSLALTPEYAAPEQYRAERVTIATDVYSIGILLGELLTGQRPGGRTAAPASVLALAMQAGQVPAGLPPAPLLTRQLRGDLDAIVAVAVAEDPAMRYRSAGALADDIQNHLEQRPVRAHLPSRWYRARKFVGRHRGALVIAALFAMGILTSLAITLWQANVAQRQTAVAREQAERAEAVRQFLLGVFKQVSPDTSRGIPIDARELLAKGERQVDSGLRDKPGLQADVLTLLGELYLELSEFSRADALLKRALVASESDRVPVDVRVRALLGAAAVDNEIEAFDDASVNVQQALDILKRMDHPHPEAIANAHNLIATALKRKRATASLEALLRANLREDRAALGDANEYVADQWLLLGQHLGDLGRYAESERAFQSGIEGFRAVFGRNNNAEAHALNELSNMLSDKGDLKGAEDALRMALAIRLDTVGEAHHDTIVVRGNLLWTMESRGHYAEALAQRVELLDRYGKTGLMHDTGVIAFYDAIGMDSRETGRLREAEAALYNALAIEEKAQGPRGSWKITTLAHLGRTLVLDGRIAEAEARFREALSIAMETDATASLLIARLRAEIGNVARLLHRPAEALGELSLAASAFGPSIGARNPWRPAILAMLSEAQLDGGTPVEARDTAVKAVDFAKQAFPEQQVRLSVPLYSLARSELAVGHPETALTLLRSVLALREPMYPASDVRLLETRVELVRALRGTGQAAQAERLQAAILPLLRESASPYSRDLEMRLRTVKVKQADSASVQ